MKKLLYNLWGEIVVHSFSLIFSAYGGDLCVLCVWRRENEEGDNVELKEGKIEEETFF